MHFEITPLPGESFKGCQAIIKESLPPDLGSLIAIAVYVAIAVAAFLFTPSTAPLTILIAVGGILALVIGAQAYGKARIRTLIASDPHALETYSIELDDAGARTWCTHVDARFPWADFKKVTENSEFFLLVRTGGSGIAIPKRVLGATEGELRERLAEWCRRGGASLALASER